MKIKFKHKDKTFSLDVKKAKIYGMGLMFKTKNTKSLLFEFEKPTELSITSLFVFFPFVAVWLDKNNKIIEVRKIRSFTLAVSPKKSFSKLVEIPANKYNKKIIKLLVGD